MLTGFALSVRYDFPFYSPEAIVYFQFLLETENGEIKSC
jgi:hypothetical protein